MILLIISVVSDPTKWKIITILLSMSLGSAIRLIKVWRGYSRQNKMRNAQMLDLICHSKERLPCHSSYGIICRQSTICQPPLLVS